MLQSAPNTLKLYWIQQSLDIDIYTYPTSIVRPLVIWVVDSQDSNTFYNNKNIRYNQTINISSKNNFTAGESFNH